MTRLQRAQLFRQTVAPALPPVCVGAEFVGISRRVPKYRAQVGRGLPQGALSGCCAALEYQFGVSTFPLRCCQALTQGVNLVAALAGNLAKLAEFCLEPLV
jgi:hypothetical protein